MILKKKKFVFKNRKSMNAMHEFYDETLASLNVPYVDSYIRTSFGRTHSLLVGDPGMPRICTIHGGNGISTLNLKLFLPLLKDFSIIAPDVVGMPEKSAPYRNISSSKEKYDEAIFIEDIDTVVIHDIKSGYTNRCPISDVCYLGKLK